MSLTKSEGLFAPSPPTTFTECPTPEATSAMLAKEMNQLSVEEREKVFEDIHGIARAVDEPLDYVQNSLVLLEEELSKITRNKVAFDLAKFQSKEYVSSEKLRLMFLRAESFDAYKAAVRMVRFFDEKHKLFGADKLTKDIVLADLDPDDIAALEKGFYQVLPERDCAGRKVLCFFPKFKVFKTTQNMFRALYFSMMRSVEDDEEAQKQGVVGCVYCVDGDLNIDLSVVRQKGNLRNALPVRFSSVHVCYNNPRMLPFFSLGMVIMGTYTRIRFRTHYGSHEECRCHLRSFGLPMSVFPVSPRGEFNLENHRSFVAMQRAIEATKSRGKGPLCIIQKARQKPTEKARSRQPIIEADVVVAATRPGMNEPKGCGGSLMGFLPRPSFANPWWSVVGAPSLPSVVPPQRQLPVVPQSHIKGPASVIKSPAKLWESPPKPHVIYDPLPNDVLLGRGKPIQERPGNVRFRDMLDKHMGKYEQGKKGGKSKVSAYIVRIVKDGGGRFLKELEDGEWVEVDEATALEKVSHAFRGRRGVFRAALKKGKITA